MGDRHKQMKNEFRKGGTFIKMCGHSHSLILPLFNYSMAVPYFNSHSLNPGAQKAYGPGMSSSGSVLNDCPQRNGVVFGLEVQQAAPNNHLNTLNPYGESFHNPCRDYRFPKVPVRVIYHQEPEQSEPLGLSDKAKAQQQRDENILYTSQSGLRIDRVWSMPIKADSQSHSINANHSPLDSTLKDTAGNGFSGMEQSTPQISSVVDNNLHQPVHIPDQDRIDTFSKPEAPIAIITPQLNSEQLQHNTSSKNEFDFNASASVSGESLTSSSDKASQKASRKAYLESDKGKAYQKAYEQSEKRKAYHKAYEQSEKRKAYRKAYEQSEKRKASYKAYRESDKGKASRKAYLVSDKGKASRKAYLQSDKGKASRKAYLQSDKAKASRKAYAQSEKRKASCKAYRQSNKGKASHKAYLQSDKGKASRKAYRQSDKGKAHQKAYRESDKGKAYQKAYQKAYHEVFKNTGDREQAKIAGKQATAFIRKSNKKMNSEFESISISPLPPQPPLRLT